MITDHEQLELLDECITRAETNGDIRFFEELLAPAFSFRRANGDIVDRISYLANVAPSPECRSDLLAVDLLSHDRAIVSSIVTIMDATHGPTNERFHNLRLFVRGTGDRNGWMLLAWANEVVSTSGHSPKPADHLSGREPDSDLELWKYYAGTGGEDKSKMVTVASWLLGFSAALLAYTATRFIIVSETVASPTWWAPVVVCAIGVGTSFAAAYVALLYGGYANRNWREADVIAWRRGWIDLLPTTNVPRASNATTCGKHLDAGEPRRLAAMWHWLNVRAWRRARPQSPDRYLAPVFEVFFVFALLALLGHVGVVVWSVIKLS